MARRVNFFKSGQLTLGPFHPHPHPRTRTPAPTLAPRPAPTTSPPHTSTTHLRAYAPTHLRTYAPTHLRTPGLADFSLLTKTCKCSMQVRLQVAAVAVHCVVIMRVGWSEPTPDVCAWHVKSTCVISSEHSALNQVFRSPEVPRQNHKVSVLVPHK